jgi:hypothetical protein
MDSNTIFVRTTKGEDEMRNKSALLVGDMKRALLMVDGTATFGEISKRAAPSLRNILDEMFKDLEKGGFIQDKAKAKAGNIPKMATPKMATPFKKPVDEGVEELDFTAAFRAPSADALAAEAKKAEAAKLKMEAEAKAQREIEAAKLKMQQEAEAARQKAEAEAKAKQQAEAARIKAEAEAKARQDIEAAKLKAQREAEEARLRAEQEAAKAREEAELAKQKALAEAKVREALERRAREEAEAARVKAEQEAARVRAELEAARAKAESEAKAREEAKRRSREAAEAAKLKAQQEAEEARRKAEQEAAKAREEAELAKQKAAAEARKREEAERRAREETEAVRLKAEQEAARVSAELEAARAKAEAEAKAREEAERRSREAAEAAKLKAQQEAETARRKAEQEAAKAREEAELAKQKVAAKARAQQEADTHKSKTGARQDARSTSATVLFFDVVGYTKQSVNKQIEIKKQFNQLVTDCLDTLGDDERIILDTGDGAAIGFLQHPEDALKVAMQFRKTVMANRHQDYPDLNVRIGIHLGPVNVVKDMNDQSNMVGDGINDAQRVMSFADIDQIYISRSYYDFVSRLSDEYAGLFQYRGLQKDKHGREHSVYELMDAAAPVAEVALPQAAEPAVTIKLEPFSFAMPEAVIPPPVPPVVAHEEPEAQQDVAALMGDIEQFNLPGKAEKPVEIAQAIPQQPPSAVPTPSASVPKTPSPEAAAKPAAEARMPSAEEVAKLAEVQAKAWAEAERRGAEAAKTSAERAAKTPETPQPSKVVQVARARRKPVPWGKVGAGLFVLSLIALFVVPYVLPTKDYATGIEQLLSARLQQPVHVGHLAGRLLPTPRLELQEVSIGEKKSIQAQQVRIDFALSALFSSDKPITGIELENVQVNGAALPQVSAWLQKIASDTQYPVARIELSQGKLEADGMQLSGIGGELSFDQAGKFTQAKLHAEGGKFALDINATPENKMQVSVTVRGSALPLLPNWVFDDLSAKGELTGDGLVITDMDSRIMGGVLLGDARIDWRSGWRAQGALTAKTITLQNMSKALSGDMDGTARFQMQSASLSKLAEATTLEGAFAVRKGIINGVDVVETARLRSKENLPGGRTHFDELSGNLYYANGDYHFRQVKMSTGVLNATATLDIDKQQLSGRVVADLTMRAGMGSVTLQVGGTTDNPSLQTAR